MGKKYIDADTLWNRLISVSENDWVGFDTIDEVLSEMPAEPRWIPVTERLPEEEGTYLVTYTDGGVTEVGSSIYLQREDGSEPYWDYFVVTAWMPLPDPYKEGEEE